MATPHVSGIFTQSATAADVASILRRGSHVSPRRVHRREHASTPASLIISTQSTAVSSASCGSRAWSPATVRPTSRRRCGPCPHRNPERLDVARPHAPVRRSSLAWTQRCRVCLELRVGIDREPGLDDVGAHLVEQRGYVAFVLVTERRAWRLLAIAQRRVENPYTVNLRSSI